MILDRHVLALNTAGFAKPFAERGRKPAPASADLSLMLLRVRRKRPRRAAKPSYELPTPRWITSSAVANFRDGKAKRLGGLEIDDELEPRGLLERQVLGPRPLENAIDQGRNARKGPVKTRGVGH